MQDDNLRELAAALNEREITDANGQITGETDTPDETTADSEPTTTEEATEPAEKPIDDTEAAPLADDVPDEDQHAVDETGKRYVPEARFKKETAKFRETERKLKALEAQLAQGNALLQNVDTTKTGAASELPAPVAPSYSKADILELKMELPQFDPNKAEYDPAVDALGYELLKADPLLTPLEAGKKALKMSREFGKREADARVAARTVKTVQSDTGITSRRSSGTDATRVDPNSMTLEEKEQFLKEQGLW